ncbi:Transthyretin-like family protein [Cooperia oncophora]
MQDEFTAIEPKLNIYHDCNDGIMSKSYDIAKYYKERAICCRPLFLLCFMPMAAALGRTQAVGVKGVLICNDKPASDVQVKLYDEDKLSPDEFMAGGKTDSSGHFEISGHGRSSLAGDHEPNPTSITNLQ